MLGLINSVCTLFCTVQDIDTYQRHSYNYSFQGKDDIMLSIVMSLHDISDDDNEDTSIDERVT
jgi:hypothetical protein